MFSIVQDLGCVPGFWVLNVSRAARWHENDAYLFHWPTPFPPPHSLQPSYGLQYLANPESYSSNNCIMQVPGKWLAHQHFHQPGPGAATEAADHDHRSNHGH